MNEHAFLDNEQLQDFLDGRLRPTQAAAVVAYLRQHPAANAEVQRLREQDALLSALGADVLDEPIPERLLEPLRRKKAMPRATSPRWRKLTSWPERGWLAPVAMATSLFLVGTWVGWIGYQYSNPMPSFDDRALSDAARAYSHYGVDRNFPVEFGPERVADLSAWIARTFQRSIEPPDISSMGFQYVGGRVLPGLRGKSGMYVFQNQAGQRVALVFWERDETGRPPPGMTSAALQGLQSKSWVTDKLGFALFGGEGLDTLDQLAEAMQGFYQNLQGPTGPVPTPVPATPAPEPVLPAPDPKTPPKETNVGPAQVSPPMPERGSKALRLRTEPKALAGVGGVCATCTPTSGAST